MTPRRPLAVICSVAALVVGGCERLAAWVPAELRNGGAPLPDRQVRHRIVGGNAEQGRAILAANAHGCVTCHTIPNIRGARGVVGPPLAGFADRSFIAGSLPNEPGILLAFIHDAPALVPGTAMPGLRISDGQARHVAAFLYSLRSVPNAGE